MCLFPLSTRRSFDFVTFPERFYRQKSVGFWIYSLTEAFGCVHVGLRPSATEPNHLFQVEELRALIRELKQIPDLTRKDLEAFEGWLKCQDEHAINVGCLFTLDADRQVRVCLHPKMVQSNPKLVHSKSRIWKKETCLPPWCCDQPTKI